MSSLKLDLSHAVRVFRRNPAFTTASLVTLALGIGGVSAIFGVMNAAMFRDLPFPDPQNVVRITEVHTQEGFRRSPGAAVREAWNEHSDLIEGVGTFGPVTEFTLSGERVYLNRVDVHAFPVLGVRPLLGRWYEPDEPMVGGTAATIIISHDLWQRRFDGDPDIIGRSLPDWTAGWGETIIGVMPPGFRVAPWLAEADAWHAMESTPNAVGRLKPGVTLEQARAGLEAMAANVRREAGDPAAALWRLELEPFQDAVSEQYSGTLYLLLGAVGFVLLIACANVANLQLSRAASRQGEMATRAALGAGRWRLLRQLLAENVVLALAGGGLGLVVALVGMRLFVSLAPDFYPPTEEIRLDLTVLLFALVVSMSVGLAFGLIPALSGSWTDLHTSMRQSGRGGTGGGRRWVRGALVVSEVTLAFVLLVGAGLMINSYARVVSVDPGLDPDNVMTMELNLRGLDEYRILHDAFSDFEVLPTVDVLYTGILDELRAIPGVAAVGMTSRLPPNDGFEFAVSIPAHPEIEHAGAQYHEINGDFFTAMDIPLLQGRSFTQFDRDESPGVAIVNQAAARLFFAEEDPLGQQVRIRIGDDRLREIVGVVGDHRTRLQNDPVPTIYVPYLQHIWHYPNATVSLANFHKEFAVRTAGAAPPGLATAMQDAVRRVNPVIAVAGIMPMRQRLDQSATGESFLMRLLGIFSGLGVFLAAVGIYGVISYTVVQRTGEFGIRLALGAPKSKVLALVVREGLFMTLLGVMLGVAAAFALTRLIESRLFGVTATDPATMIAVVCLLTGVSLAACGLPAWRAASQSPVVALKGE